GEARAMAVGSDNGGGVAAEQGQLADAARPWALAGLAVGGIGLVGVAGYLLRARRIKLGLGKGK
ncbi:MAG: hypothetical protein RR572_01420, partial [Raoultibacter sp.]